MIHKIKLDKTIIIVNCSNTYQKQLDDLFTILAKLNTKGPHLKNGTIIDFGWSRLILKGSKHELVIHEPDFFKNPFYDFVPQVDITMKILVEQITLLNTLGIEGITAKFSDKIVISKGSLAIDKIYLERSDISKEPDSGWYIGTVDESNAADPSNLYEPIYVFQLLQLRPALMQILALPPGYLVVFIKDEIIQIFNNDGKNIWI